MVKAIYRYPQEPACIHIKDLQSKYSIDPRIPPFQLWIFRQSPIFLILTKSLFHSNIDIQSVKVILNLKKKFNLNIFWKGSFWRNNHLTESTWPNEYDGKIDFVHIQRYKFVILMNLLIFYLIRSYSTVQVRRPNEFKAL